MPKREEGEVKFAAPTPPDGATVSARKSHCKNAICAIPRNLVYKEANLHLSSTSG